MPENRSDRLPSHWRPGSSTETKANSLDSAPPLAKSPLFHGSPTEPDIPCITFKAALTGDVAKIALESGNSPAVVHQHYRGLAIEADARAFFPICPTGAR